MLGYGQQLEWRVRNESRHHSQHCQSAHRHHHHQRRFRHVRVAALGDLFFFVAGQHHLAVGSRSRFSLTLHAATELAVEGHEQRPEDVEGRHEHRSHRKEEHYSTHKVAVVERLGQDLIFAPEPRQREYPGQAQRRDDKHAVGPWLYLAQTAHEPHIKGASNVVDAASAQEQQGLEERVVEQVEHRSGVRADTQRQHHVPKLADGGVGDHSLDVIAGHRHRCSKDCRDAAGDGHQVHRRIRGLEDREHPRDQEHTCGHHGGGVNEGAHRCGAFHGVREPDVQRELCRFAYSSRKEPNGQPCESRCAKQTRSSSHIDIAYIQRVQA